MENLDAPILWSMFCNGTTKQMEIVRSSDCQVIARAQHPVPDGGQILRRPILQAGMTCVA